MMHRMMMHGYGVPDAWWGGWAVVGTVWMLLLLAFWVLVLTGLALLVRWLWRVTSQRATSSTPLKARYAKGEISRQEFEAMKQDLAL